MTEGEMLGPDTLQSSLLVTHCTSAPPSPPRTLARGSALSQLGPRIRGQRPPSILSSASLLIQARTDFPAWTTGHITLQSQHLTSSARPPVDLRQECHLRENLFPSVPTVTNLFRLLDVRWRSCQLGSFCCSAYEIE